MALALKMLLIISTVYLSFANVNHLYLKMLGDEMKLSERIKLEQLVIKRINQEFYDYDNKDFTINLYDTTVVVVYDDLQAMITATGKHHFNSSLVYNDDYGTIDDYYYIDNE